MAPAEPLREAGPPEGFGALLDDRVLAPGGRLDAGILGTLFDALPARVVALDADGRYVYANREALDFFGASLDEITGRTVAEVLGEAMDQRTTPLLEQLRLGETPRWTDWAVYKDGQRRFVEQLYAPCMGSDGRLIGFLAFIRDMTELKLREETLERRLAALDEQERVSTAIIKTSIDAIMVVDEEGVLLDLNPAAMTTFGYSRAAAVGRTIADLIIPPTMRGAHAAGMARYTATGISRVLDQRLTVNAMRADGTIFPIELTISEIRLPGRRVFTAHLRDLTAARAAEEEMARQRDRLHQAEKLSAMGSLLAGVAHELNNPLAILVAQSTLLVETSSDLNQRRRAERIHAAAERAGRIVKSFLAMARQKPEKREHVAVNPLISATIDMLAYGLRSHGIGVETRLDPTGPAVIADADFLGQVIANLVVNAQHALAEQPEPRRIVLATRHEPDTVVIEVSDNGPGVPAHLRERIFEPYFTTKPTGVGTGIGLSISKSVVGAHGGTIALDTAAEGGARFVIRLPVATAQPGAGTPAADTADGSFRVLVVDDETDVRESLAEMLELLGHQVLPPLGAREALDSGVALMADLVFVDLRMPGIDGLRFRDAVLASNPRLDGRVVIMTGDAVEGPGLIARHPDAARIPIMEKPFTLGDVKRILAEYD
ncbi:PAS domain S-box protein [Phreatobacter sp.]|uniref:PAS domain S-box protein n=1 Tax=Phreatobacter sp. TaxID=1966341 RepID=UPI003F7296C4